MNLINYFKKWSKLRTNQPCFKGGGVAYLPIYDLCRDRFVSERALTYFYTTFALQINIA
jgi:hypothetical protein